MINIFYIFLIKTRSNACKNLPTYLYSISQLNVIIRFHCHPFDSNIFKEKLYGRREKVGETESSATPKPQFETVNFSFKKANIVELQSMKNQYIEEIYSTTNENHKEIFKRLIERLEDRQIDIAEDYYWTNGSLPDDSIIFFKPEPEIHNKYQ